jgi:hypothetical protein
MTPDDDDRRQFARIHLDESIPGRLGETPVVIVELSVTGFLLAHQARIAPAATQKLVAEWSDKSIAATCSVTRSVLYRVARDVSEPSIYHSGARIVETLGKTDAVLRDLIQERVLRALEEQKANARGIPPLAVFSEHKGDRFRRCELVEGVWRKTETNKSLQPLTGFTISADVDRQHVEMLCQTYAAGNAEVRRLTQVLAQLSISKNEGVVTRKYVP